MTKFKLIQAFKVVILSTSIKKINSKLKALERSQHFSHYKYMGIFSDAQGQVAHKPPNRILPNFKPIPEFIDVLDACKNEEDPIKNEGR